MPKALLDFMGYVFFFWSREDGELPHVHVCKGAPSKVSAKFWIKEVVLTFSNISRNKDGFASIVARFERPNATGFDFSEWQLPCIANTKAFGFSEDDIMMQERYLRNNMPLIWEMAREKEKEMQKSA